jgi:hypothetical protein
MKLAATKEITFTAPLAAQWLATYPPTNPPNPERITRFTSLMQADGILFYENRPRVHVRAFIGINSNGAMEIGSDFLRAIVGTGKVGLAQIMEGFTPIKKGGELCVT